MAPAARSTSVEIPDKLYFRIGEVGRLCGVQPHTLRYWETEFGRLRPIKSDSGQRRYSRADVELILRIKDLLWGRKFTIAGARTALAKGEEKEQLPVEEVAIPAELIEREEEVADQEVALGKREAELAAQAAAIAALEAAVREQGADVAEREAALAARSEALAASEARAASLQASAQGQAAEAAASEALVAGRERAIAERERVLKEREATLEARLRQAQEALAAREAQDQRAFESALQEHLHEIDMLRTRAQLLEGRADEAVQELEDVRVREARMTRAMAQVRRGIIELRHRLHEAGQNGS